MHPLLFNKVLPVFVLPLGVSLLLLAAALRWRRRILIGLPLAVLWLSSTPVLADRLIRTLEDRYPYRSDSQCPNADAVFVLGGGILGARDGPGTHPAWGPSSDRFERALDLYLSGHAHFLVLSAGEQSHARETGEGDRLREIALQRGVPSDAIVVTRETVNTAAEADALEDLAARGHWQRVLLVTSAFHMPRAMQLFRQSSIEIIPVPADYQTSRAGSALPGVGVDQFFPQAEALFRSERTLREYMGILFYSIVRHGSGKSGAHA